jgi:hypothetical protein
VRVGHPVKTVTVAEGDDPRTALQEWAVERETVRDRWAYILTVRSLDGRVWSAEAGDTFACLIELRREMEPLGIRLCCNGSRRDAWASGMQRDMGGGESVYLCAGVPRGTQPPEVLTLDWAPAWQVVTVAEQLAWHEAWLEDRMG